MDPAAQFILRLVIMGAFGAITSVIAASKGRSALGWFFVGFFFSCIGLIVALCVSDLKEEQARWSAAETEQRRLREQLRQERIKSEGYRQQVDERLDLHDQALGMNTRQLAHTGDEPARLESDQSAEADEDAAVEFIRQDESPPEAETGPGGVARTQWLCAWCGTLVPETSEKCTGCGQPRWATSGRG